MGSRGIRDDVAPWSFFLPVTLAVVVGGLLAGLVLRGIDAVFFSATDATEIARRPVAVQREATASPRSAPDTRASDASPLTAALLAAVVRRARHVSRHRADRRGGLRGVDASSDDVARRAP